MIGKPPTLTYEGIGYTAPALIKLTADKGSQRSSPVPNGNLNVVYPSLVEARPRPSIASSFSEYDDLRDFEGRFESRSMLASPRPSPPGQAQNGGAYYTKRKASKGIFERLKGSGLLAAPSQGQEKEKEKDKDKPSRKLRALTSMGSLRNKGHLSRKSESLSPQPILPPALQIDVGLGLEDLSWTHSIKPDICDIATTPQRILSTGSLGSGSSSTPRSSGRRSISFTSTSHATGSTPGPPSPSSVFSTPAPPVDEGNYQAQLGNALIAASHAESSKGTTNDLLQILNHENHSWGFSYENYPHRVRVWYGDKDEKIAENAVRWMERAMGPDRCSVKVVNGADHGLMYRSSAVVDVLEWILSAWKEDRLVQPFSDLRLR